MAFRAVRRAATLATALAITVTGLALADTTPADADTLTAGVQGSRYLGGLAPGGTTTVDVGFTLRCTNGSHAERSSTITLGIESETVPLDGAISLVTPGSIGPVPDDWPLEGEACPGGTGDPLLEASAPARVQLTAPTTVGTGYEYVLLFARTPDSGISGFAAVTLTLDVVEPAPVDTTPPTLADVPSDITVTTLDPVGVAVTWTGPTATDDNDPAPVVACAPASGSVFAIGSTTVTCVATDAAGNAADASFTVSVDLDAGGEATAEWGAPLGRDMLVANQGRVVPVKVDLKLDGVLVNPGGDEAPELRVDRLEACGGTAMQSGPDFALTWDGSRWTHRLDTSLLPAGCWRLTATAGATIFGSTEMLISESAVGKATAHGGHARR